MNWQMIIGTVFAIGGIVNLLSDTFNALITLSIGFALLYWGVSKKGYLKDTYAKPTSKTSSTGKRTLTEETIHAVGVSYYEANIRKLAYANPDWKLSKAQIVKGGKTGKRIFKNNYANRPVKLVLEPENPHDENAIQVVFAGEVVGYISREDNLRIKSILDNREIISLSGFIGGGEYKFINEDGDLIKAESGFSVNVRIKYI